MLRAHHAFVWVSSEAREGLGKGAQTYFHSVLPDLVLGMQC